MGDGSADILLALAIGRGTLEQIADLVGHSGTKTAETFYRHQLQPVLRDGAGIMDEIFADLTEVAPSTEAGSEE